MSWNIEKPGDRINGPVTITGNTTLTGTATISGDLTVDTSTLKVDAANNRVGVGTASPSTTFDVVGDAKVSGGLVIDTTSLVVDAANNRVGIGTATPNATVSIKQTGAQIDVSTSATDVTFEAIDRAATTNAINTRWYTRNGEFQWNNSSYSRAMTLDSSGRLGIGTATPAYPLDISASKAVSRLTSSTGTNGAFSFFSNTGGAFYIGLDNSAGTEFSAAYSGAIWHSGAYPIVFATSNAEKMRLDSSGNLGLGVTPKVWNGNYRAIQIGLSGAIFNDNFNEDLNVSSNAYYDSTDNRYEFIRTGYAQRYTQTNGGQHRWYTSTSAGNADTAITFTQAMTLDASGRLSVGPADFAYMSGSMMIARKDQSAITYIGVDNQQNNSAAGAGIDLEAYGGSWYIYNAHSSNFTNPLIFKMGSNERIRFTANGEALFKTNGTSSTPTIANADNPDTGLYWPTNADTLALAVGGSDAVYIDANRRVGIGTPTPNAGLVISSSGAQGFEFSPNNAGVAQLETYNRSTAAYFSLRINSDDLRICTGSSATERLRIKSTGQVNFVGLASDPAGAAAGDVYYNTTTNKLKCYNGSAWNDLF